MARKKFQELNLTNAFLFAAALEDRETCRMLLEVLLDTRISDVEVHPEHTLLFGSDYRSIRLDIYARDASRTEFNVEMQQENQGNLPKRSRFHQAEMDVTSLEPREDFNALRPCYIVFICTFDPFGFGKYRYTFENRCLEADFPLGDETRKVFLNTKGRNPEEVPEELVQILRYVTDGKQECGGKEAYPAVNRLHRRVTELKKSREWERRYMTFGELLQDAEKKGLEQGLEQGREAQRRLTALIGKMAEAGETEQLVRLTDDAFLNEMYRKYQL